MKEDDTYEEVDAPVHKDSGEFFLNRYRQIAPDAEPVAPDAVRQALRVNVLRTTSEELERVMVRRGVALEPIPWLRHAFFVEARFSLGATPEYLLGHYYLQGPLSQLACEVLGPAPGSAVLDMASAPGGKATYLAEMVGEHGYVVALDNDASRLASVRNNAERLGVANIICVKKDARFAFELRQQFPFVLLDAPCSGNFCSEEGWFSKRTIEDIRRNARAQRELLRAAHQCVAPDGRILYSTCSLEPEEDELIIDWALQKFPDLDVVPIEAPLGDAGMTAWQGTALDARLARTRRFWPHKTGMDGFFMALLVKRPAKAG